MHQQNDILSFWLAVQFFWIWFFFHRSFHRSFVRCACSFGADLGASRFIQFRKAYIVRTTIDDISYFAPKRFMFLLCGDSWNEFSLIYPKTRWRRFVCMYVACVELVTFVRECAIVDRTYFRSVAIHIAHFCWENHLQRISIPNTKTVRDGWCGWCDWIPIMSKPSHHTAISKWFIKTVNRVWAYNANRKKSDCKTIEIVV